MESEPLIYRDEVIGTLFVLEDMSADIQRIRDLLEEEFDGEEGLQENDS